MASVTVGESLPGLPYIGLTAGELWEIEEEEGRTGVKDCLLDCQLPRSVSARIAGLDAEDLEGDGEEEARLERFGFDA